MNLKYHNRARAHKFSGRPASDNLHVRVLSILILVLVCFCDWVKLVEAGSLALTHLFAGEETRLKVSDDQMTA